FLFFSVPATSAFSPLSLHDALPICTGTASPRHRWHDDRRRRPLYSFARKVISTDTCDVTGEPFSVAGLNRQFCTAAITFDMSGTDRKSTRLNSSHQIISYAVFCLKK